MIEVVEKYLKICLATYPTYGDASAASLAAKANIFAELFEANKLSPEDVAEGFKHHLSTSEKFPVPVNIINAVKPQTVYQMDDGPDGFGAIYHKDHPYVRRQAQVGTQLSRYATTVKPSEAMAARVRAENAPPLVESSEDDEEVRVIEPRRGSGLRLLSFDK